MPQDICLSPARPARVPRFAILIGLLALLAAVIASGEPSQTSDIDAAAPAPYEDWHGNVRRSH